VLKENSTKMASENKYLKNDLDQRDVPSDAPSPHLQPEKPEDTKPAAESCPSSKMYAEASAAVNILSNSFAHPNGGNYHPSFPTNHFAAPDVTLITQPLITTPGGMQLSALFNSERHSDYRHGFTPRPGGQPGLLPGQSSVITNRTYSNTPRPFAPSMFPMQRSTSTTRTYSSNSVFGDPSSQERMPYFNFGGFTPMMQIPPSGPMNPQEMPTPSPLIPISTHQMAALGYSNPPQDATTPLHSFVHNNQSVKLQSKKKKPTKPKVAKPAARLQPEVDVSAVMTLEVSARACKCPKNQCVKLYCECFHRGQVCDPSECNCKKCLNTAAESGPTGARTKRVKELLSRKGSNAFKVKPKKTGVGCMCKKSR